MMIITMTHSVSLLPPAQFNFKPIKCTGSYAVSYIREKQLQGNGLPVAPQFMQCERVLRKQLARWEELVPSESIKSFLN